MKKIIVFLIFLQIWSLAYAQTPSFEDRINAVDEYASVLKKVEAEINSVKVEIESYKNAKIIEKDQQVLKGLNFQISKIFQDVSANRDYVESERIKKELVELKRLIHNKELYANAQNKSKSISENEANSPRLKKYIQSVIDGKDKKSQIIYFTLSQKDQVAAQAFDNANTYLIRERYMQEPLEKEIQQQKKKIDSSLSYPEEAVREIKQSLNDLKAQEAIFQNLKSELSSTQYDFKFETWSLGLFNCESKASYFKPTEFDNLIMLKNEDSLMSVIKIDSEHPKTFQIVYHCKKPGRFGGCLDNTQKELCRLDQQCLKSLLEMESSYQRNDFFSRVRPFLAAELLGARLKDYRDNEKFNLLKAMDESKKLGHYSLEELYSMMDPIIEISKKIEAKTPEEYLKKIKLEIEKSKKIAIDQIIKKNGAGANTPLMDQTKASLNYLYTSMQTELEVILSDDVIQNRSYKDCEKAESGNDQFCRASREWKDRVRVFEPKKEIKNLTPNECPRGVFRLDAQYDVSLKNDCSLETLGELEKFIENVEQKLGN